MQLYFGHDPWIKEAVFALRKAVFVEEQGISPALEFDQNDQFCDYFLLANEQEPIATIRYQSLDSKRIQPDRFCVAKNYRKQGIGRYLLTAYEQKAIAEGFSRSILSSEIAAVGFYQKCGYELVSAPFEEDGILCVAMEKKLL
jgi:predicted GNAT family N-acyltransferase